MKYKKYYSSDGFDYVLYQDLSLEDSVTVLSYRNNLNVRQWMFNLDEITKEDHFTFIDSLKNNKEKEYCAVFRKNKIVACVYYTTIAKGEYFAGHFLNPRLLSSGIGLYFEYVYLKFFFEYIKAKVIKATVKKENYAMIKIHRLCNFKESLNQNPIYYNYEFTLNEYNNIPDNINNFVTELMLKYHIKLK